MAVSRADSCGEKSSRAGSGSRPQESGSAWQASVPRDRMITAQPFLGRARRLPAFLGYSFRQLLSMMVLGFGSTLAEGLGVAVMLPIFARLEGKADAVEQSRITAGVEAVFSLIGVPSTLGNLILLAAVLVLVLQAFLFSFTFFQAKVRNLAITRCRMRAFEAVLSADISFSERLRSGTLQNAVVSEAEMCADTGLVVVQLASVLLKAVIYMAISLLISWQATLVIGSVILAIGLLTTKAAVRRSGSVGESVTQAKDRLSRFVADRMHMLRLVKLAGTAPIELAEFEGRNLQLAGYRLRLARLDAMMQAFIEPTAMLLGLVGLYLAVEVAGASLASIGVFVVILFRMLPVARQAMTARQKLAVVWASITYLDRLEAFALSCRLPEGANQPFPPLEHNIRFENVSFAYTDDHGHTIPAVSDINFEITAGSMVALLGASGAGKSTVMDLLARLRLPSGGQVTVDGVDIRDISSTAFAAAVSMVSQETLMVDGTVMDNIAYGCVDNDRNAVEAAARAAFADGFILALPQGYDTMLGERGVRLSGGQRQRIGLARALLRRTPLLLLDEPTSALDAESELAIHRALEELRREQRVTIVIIAHRLSTVRDADQTIVLEEGRVLGSGRHEELMTRAPWYRRVVELQAGAAAKD